MEVAEDKIDTGDELWDKCGEGGGIDSRANTELKNKGRGVRRHAGLKQDHAIGEGSEWVQTIIYLFCTEAM